MKIIIIHESIAALNVRIDGNNVFSIQVLCTNKTKLAFKPTLAVGEKYSSLIHLNGASPSTQWGYQHRGSVKTMQDCKLNLDQFLLQWNVTSSSKLIKYMQAHIPTLRITL